MTAKLVTMTTTVKLFQRFLASTILLLVLLQNANPTRHYHNEAQAVRNLKDNLVKYLLFHEVNTDIAGVNPAVKLRIKRQSDRNRSNTRPVPLPILVGGGGIGGVGRVIQRKASGARDVPNRGFGPRSIGARGFGGRGIGGLGRGGGFNGRGRG